jgi:tetratricopeptide (TPR) repeat protein
MLVIKFEQQTFVSEALMRKTLSLIAILVLTGNLDCHAAARRASRPAATSGKSGVILSTPNPRTPLDHNNRGVELGSKGLWPDAIREHEEALNGDPENQTFRVNLSSAELSYARVLARSGKTYDAMVRYREALYADPNNSDADHELDILVQKSSHKDPLTLAVRQNMAEEAESSGNFPVAIVEYRKCVKIADSGPMHARLGAALLKQRKPVDGFVELKLALTKDWSNSEKKELADTHRQLADILKQYALLANQNGKQRTAILRLDNAAIEYRRALTITPDSSDAQRGLIEVAREAVGLNPNSFDNHLMLGGAYQLQGDFERAKDEYEKCWRIRRDDPRLTIARRSYHLAVVSHPSLATPLILASTIQKVENSLADNPNDAELLYIYARGKETQQDAAGALKAYQAAAAINPYIFPDLQDRIRSLSGGGPAAAVGASAGQAQSLASAAPGAAPGVKPGDKGTPPGALASAAPTAPAAPPEPPKDTAAYAEIESKINANALDDAEKKASEVVEKNPKDSHGWSLLGDVRKKKKDLDSASVAYRMAMSLKEPGGREKLNEVENDRVKPQMDQADQYLRENKLAEALSAARDAVTLAPGLPSVHRKLAEVMRKMGDSKGAEAEENKASTLEKNAK